MSKNIQEDNDEITFDGFEEVTIEENISDDFICIAGFVGGDIVKTLVL